MQDLPLRFHRSPQARTRTAEIVFKSSATLLRDLLPSTSYRFTSKDTVAYASFRLRSRTNPDRPGGLEHCSLSFYIHGIEYVKSTEEAIEGSYLAVMFEDSADPLVEELGFPNVYSKIDVETGSDSLTAVLSWNGATWARITWPSLQQQQTATVNRAVASESPGAAGNVLVHRYIPGVGKREDTITDTNYAVMFSSEGEGGMKLCRQVCTTPATVSFHSTDGERFPTLHHIVSRLAELPQIEIVKASIVDSKGGLDLRDGVRIEGV